MAGALGSKLLKAICQDFLTLFVLIQAKSASRRNAEILISIPEHLLEEEGHHDYTKLLSYLPEIVKIVKVTWPLRSRNPRIALRYASTRHQPRRNYLDEEYEVRNPSRNNDVPEVELVLDRRSNSNARTHVEIGPGAAKTKILDYPPDHLSNELKKLLRLKARLQRT